MINVMYSSDDNYLRHAAASICSLLENSNGDDITIHFVSNKLSKESKSALEKLVTKYNQKIIYYEIDDVLKGLILNDNFPLSSYARLFIENLVQVDRIIYLDCDTIVRSSLKQMYDFNIDNYYVAGVQDEVPYYEMNIIGMNESDRYINAGVLLINLKKWREDQIRNKFLNFVNQRNGKVQHHDQGILNGVCKGKIKIIEPKFNFMSQFFMYNSKQVKRLFKLKNFYSQSEIDKSMENPVVIHYISKFFMRPWENSCTHPYLDEYVFYAKKSGFYEKELCKKEKFGVCLRKTVYRLCPFVVYLMFERMLDVKRKKYIRSNYTVGEAK